MPRSASLRFAATIVAACLLLPQPTEGRAPGDDAAATLLARPVTLRCNRIPMTRAIRQLRAQTGGTIVFHTDLLEEDGVRPDSPVSLVCCDIRLDVTLSLLLQSWGLSHEVREGAIWILPRGHWHARRQTKSYDVRDLRWDRPDSRSGESGFVEIVEVLTSVCSPQAWRDVGGPGGVAERDGVLHVSQSWIVHDEIATTLAEVRRVRAGRPGEEAEAWSDAPMRRRMGRPVEWSFADLALGEFAARLSAVAECPVAIDWYEVEDADVRVSGAASGRPLGEALDACLEASRLGWIERHDAIVITTRDQAAERLATRFYNVRDLARRDARGGGTVHDCDALIELATCLVGPQSWDEVGGPGSISDFDGLLCVSQTEENHAEIRALLALLRRFGRRANAPVETLSVLPFDVLPRLQSERRAIGFSDTFLEDALLAISRRFEIPIAVDRSVWREVDPDATFTLPPRDWTIAEALNVVAARPLAWHASSGQIEVIACYELAERMDSALLTRFYDLRDLAAQRGSLRVTQPAARHVLMETIEPQSWDEVGGPGSIWIYKGLLIVSQTVAVHRRIERLLDQWRERRGL